jgi:hypothetical protein
VLLSGELEVAVVVSLTGLAAMSLGLLVSALASNADKVLTILPVILFAQFVLSGSAFPVSTTPGLNQISYLAAARWGYSGAASTARLDDLLGDGCNGAPAPRTAPGEPRITVVCDPAHAPTLAAWSQDMGLLGGLIVLSVGGACLAVRPIGRPKRK